MEAPVIAAGLVLGLIFGSFATVAAHRIPRREQFVSGRSRCPHCGAQIGALENIPVVSYLLLRGRCRHCGARISKRYPIIEAAIGLLFALSAAKFGLSVEAVVYAAFFWVLVVLTVIDLDHKLLPNRVVIPTFVAGWAGLVVAALADSAPSRLGGAGLGALIFGGFLFLLAFIYPAGMGMGDVKLAFVLGSFVGYLGAPGLVLLAMFLSFFIGGVSGVAVMAVQRGGRKTMIPFGPFLAAGTVLTILVGQRMLDWYLGTL